MKEIKGIIRIINSKELIKYKQKQIFKKNTKNTIYIKILIFTGFFLLIIFLLYKFLFKYKGNNYFKTSYHYINNSIDNSAVKKLHDEFKDVLPKISLDNNIIPSLEEIFNSRILYINDANISKKYINYIRPIDEEEEKKYKIRYSENETYVSPDNYKKREGQYDFKTFGKLCLDEKLIDSSKIEYNNKPLISIVLPSYNREDRLLISVRSIQNQNFKNIEIIIVNDCSTDNSKKIFKYLLDTDPRIRIFHHLKNLGCWRSRIDGILYSKAKYVILFDTGDMYEDNYVLEDAYNTINKYNLDTAKFLFRRIHSRKIVGNYKMLDKSKIIFHVNKESRIIYEPKNIFKFNRHIFKNWGNIWIRITRANIFIKGFLLLTDKILNFYKNVWDDVWFNSIISYASYSFLVFERVGYIYLNTGLGAGSIRFDTEEGRDKAVREWIMFLYFDYNFLPKEDNKSEIINTLKIYNTTTTQFQLNYIKSNFYILNDLIIVLINDPYVKKDDKIFLEKLLEESKNRERKQMYK